MPALSWNIYLDILSGQRQLPSYTAQKCQLWSSVSRVAGSGQCLPPANFWGFLTHQLIFLGAEVSGIWSHLRFAVSMSGKQTPPNIRHSVWSPPTDPSFLLFYVQKDPNFKESAVERDLGVAERGPRSARQMDLQINGLVLCYGTSGERSLKSGCILFL